MKQILLFLFIPFVFLAQEYPLQSANYVTDVANVLTEEQEKKLNNLLKNFEDSTSVQLFVYIAPSLNGSVMADLCQNIFHNWQIGQKSKNNGLLLAVFVDDRKSRIHVGYGLEGAIPDLLTQQIQQEKMNPHFKNGDYFSGIEAAVNDLIYYSKHDYKAEVLETGVDWVSWTLAYVFNLLLLIGVLFNLNKKNAKARKNWVKTLITVFAIVLFLLPCVGAFVLLFVFIFTGNFKSSKGGGYSFGSGWSGSDSSSSYSSSSNSSFDGGGGGDSGGGGSDSSW